jgi:sugar lactone lactonase YvrE
VLEIAKHGLLAAESAGPDDMEAAAGALFRVLPDGTQHEIASAGLVIPGGVAVGPDGTIYVTNFGIFSGAGQLVRLDY